MNAFNAAEWLSRWQEAGGAFVCTAEQVALLEPVDSVEAVSIRTRLRDELNPTGRRAAVRMLIRARRH